MGHANPEPPAPPASENTSASPIKQATASPALLIAVQIPVPSPPPETIVACADCTVGKAIQVTLANPAPVPVVETAPVAPRTAAT